jgi:hypothetical protein
MEPTAAPFHFYLASVPGDMDDERAVIERLVLPELRARAAKLGIEVAIADPAKDIGEPWDLARRFREIEAGRPFFLALIGERYGDPPSAVPPELAVAQSWLVEDPGRSVLELEILQGVLRDPGRAAGSFFYFRDPSFPSSVPEVHRGRFLAESQEAAERLSRLKDRIRASGRPVLDGYPRLDALAERMLEDLWGAIQERAGASRVVHPERKKPRDERDNPIEQSVTAADPSGDPAPVGGPPRPPWQEEPRGLDSTSHLPPEKALPVHEDVQFTVYRPRVVEPLKWYPLLAFAHLSELPEDAAPDEPDPVQEVEAQAQRLLGDLAQEYGDVKEDSRYAVPHEAEITFLPEIPGFEVNPPRRTFLWLESVQREEFRIRARTEVDGTLVRGRMTVFWGSILLAEINLGIRVDSQLAGASVQPPPERVASRPFRGIFPSYSHRDAGILEEFERYARAMGDRYLRDINELRAGEVWNDRLKDLIRQADVFQLFWSWNAMQSPDVEEEWRYALSLGRPHFVRPTYWEDPLPQLPQRSLPPEELRRLHFQLLPKGMAPRTIAPGLAEPPVPVTAGRSFDPNATILTLPSAPNPPEPDLGAIRAAAPASISSAPPLDKTAVSARPPLPTAPPPRPPRVEVVAAARPQGLPPLPADYGSARASTSRSRSGTRWVSVAAMIALAVIGLSTFLMRPMASPNPDATPQEEADNLEDPDRVPVISADIWPLMTRVCGVDETAERELPGRAQGGAPIVQVYSSINTEEALGTLSRLQDRGAFLLPIEEDGTTYCTVALGPFPTLDSAREYAGGLRASGVAPEAQVAYFPFFTR